MEDKIKVTVKRSIDTSVGYTYKEEKGSIFTEMYIPKGSTLYLISKIGSKGILKSLYINGINIITKPIFFAHTYAIKNATFDTDIIFETEYHQGKLFWEEKEGESIEVWTSDAYSDAGQPSDFNLPLGNYGTGTRRNNGDKSYYGEYIFYKPLENIKNLIDLRVDVYSENGIFSKSLFTDEDDNNIIDIFKYGNVIFDYPDVPAASVSYYLTPKTNEDKKYKINIKSNNKEYGIINKEIISENDDVTFLKLHAIPNNNYIFKYWILIDDAYIEYVNTNILEYKVTADTIFIAVFEKSSLVELKLNLNKRCLNCLENNTKLCTLPKEFVSDVLLLDVIEAAETTNNTYILDNIVDKFSNVYPYEQCKSTCQLCK